MSENNTDNKITDLFINHAAGILGNTTKGLTNSEIIEYFTFFAVEFGVKKLTYSETPEFIKKSTVLKDNLKCFNSEQQFQIIKTLCELPKFENNDSVKKLKEMLLSKYGKELNTTLVEQTQHWLSNYPEVLEIYNGAIGKYSNDIYQRNLLDDLRLALEMLLQQLLKNNQSLEKQIAPLGKWLKDRGNSPEMNNMFVKLVEYFAKYQNTYVKHDDKVNHIEVEFIVELTSSFMRFLIRIKYN